MNFVIFVLIAVTQDPSAVSAVSPVVTATVVASVVVVVASVVVVVASVVVVVASVVVVVASVVVVGASVVVVAVVASVVSVGFSSVVSVETVGIVSIVFLPKKALIPDVLSSAHRIPMARKMITRNVMSPARPGSLADLVSLTFFLDFLTVVTGWMLLSWCPCAFETPLVAATGCLPLASKGEYCTF